MPDLRIVGVGASAGGLEALELFFSKVPSDSGLTFVVVQHLSPDFKSLMKELLSTKTDLAIHRIEDGMRMEPNSIYLNPPRQNVRLSSGRLSLSEFERDSLPPTPIDRLFESLADELGSNAVGVILSGSGSDGSIGLRAIANAGGMTLVQDPRTAQFDGMPLSALRTSPLHVKQLPEHMAEDVIRYTRLGALEEPLETTELIVRLLQGVSDIDFSLYKEGTIGRRIRRRMSILDIEDPESYTELLRSSMDERKALSNSLLVGVTEFFRDPEAFAVLEKKVLPDILPTPETRDAIRLWVPACSSGEEAYSLAMLFHERLGKAHLHRLKVFATDVDRRTLEEASQSVFDEAALLGVSAARRERFFEVEASHSRVAKRLRQSIVFAPHNLLSDAPFRDLDLVSCRNLLIYLQPWVQQRVLSLLHMSLKKGGCLFLGPSESLGTLESEYEVLDGRWRIYRKIRERRLSSFDQVAWTPRRGSSRAARTPRGVAPESLRHPLAKYESLLEEHMPPSFLVDERFRLVHAFGGAQRVLRIPKGRTSIEIAELVDPVLRRTLSSLLAEAARKQESITYRHGVWPSESGHVPAEIVVSPQIDSESGKREFFIKFSLLPSVEASSVGESLEASELAEARIDSLESELQVSQANLRESVEQLEAGNEELQTANEELVVANEELQSTNEELHSVNEELHTVNVEHQKKIEELNQANNDMDNLLATTRVGVVFLDRERRIRRFTPAIAKYFDLLPGDIGRCIDTFASPLKGVELAHLIKEIYDHGQPIEREVKDLEGRHLLLRVYPYHIEREIKGTVLTLIDIDSLRRAEEDFALFKHMSEHAFDSHVLFDSTGRVIYANAALGHMLGYSVDELLNRQYRDLAHPGEDDIFSTLSETIQRGDVPVFEAELQRSDGMKAAVEVSVSSVRFQGAEYFYATMRDVSARKASVRRLATEHAVTQALSDSGEREEVLQAVLRAILENLEFDVVEYWSLAGKKGGFLERVAVQGVDPSGSARVEEFGRDVAGTAMESGRPFSSRDLGESLAPPELSQCRRLGLTTVLAFPVRLGEKVLGTVTCFSKESVPFDDSLKRSLMGIGREVGQFLMRLQNDEQLRLRDRAIAAITSGIVIVDAKSKDLPISWINEGFTNITGYSFDDAVGRNCRFLQGPDSDKEVVRKIRQSLESRTACRATLLNYRRDGTSFWNELQINPVENDRGVVSHFVGILTDVTEKKRIEESLREAQEEADQANLAKSEFLANMSHEIRTPLSAVLGFADILRSRVVGSEALEYVQTIRRNGRYLLQLLDDILDLSKIEAGKMQVKVKDVSIVELVSDIYSLMTEKARIRDLSLGVCFRTLVPRVVKTDSVRVRQILVNLIGNAIKFTEEGGVGLEIEYAEDEDGSSRMLFVVSDTGIGIAQRDLQGLFEPFQQGEKTLPHPGGTGLGLSICRRLARQLSGDVSVESELGRGSAFTLRLPMAIAEGTDFVEGEVVAVLPGEDRIEADQLQGCRVIVVDDRDDVRQSVCLVLIEAGAEVDEANNGKVAVDSVLEACGTGRPHDLVIMDMQMPKMTGYEATKVLRARGFQGAIVALTAAAMKGEKEDCLDAGCDVYLTKPVSGDDLIQLVDRLVRERRDRQSGHLTRSEPRNDRGKAGLSILVVEDDPDSAAALSTLLEMSGHRVVVAHTGQDAIDQMDETTFEAVVMDLGLPDRDGFSVRSEIGAQRETDPTLYVALTGQSGEDERRRALEAGFHHYLVKPVDMAVLEARLREGR